MYKVIKAQCYFERLTSSDAHFFIGNFETGFQIRFEKKKWEKISTTRKPTRSRRWL